MPVVPYRENQVEQKPLPGVRQDSVASPGLFSAGAQAQVQFGRQVGAAGEDLNSIAVKMAERENADMLFRAETALKTEYIGYEQTARERRGDAAKNITKDTADWWDKKTAEHTENLSNPAQKRLFAQQATKLRLQSVDGMSAYEVNERRTSLNESSQASIVSSTNLAASQVGTPTEMAAINGAKDDILKRLEVTRKVNGWSPELYEAKEKEALTNLHMQVVQNMVNSDPTRAKAYFEANKGEINGTQYDTAERLWKTGAAKEKAQQVSAELQAAGSTEASGLTYIRQTLKGEEQEQAAIEWKTRWQEQSVARERGQKDAADTAYQIYSRTGRLSAIPADIIQKMDGKVLLGLKHDAELRAENKLPKTDWDGYYALRNRMLAEPNKYAAGAYDLRKDFTYLGPGERKELMGLQEKFLKPDEIKELQTVDGQISGTIGPLKLGTGVSAQAENIIRGAITAEAKARGKNLTPEERQTVIDRMLIQGEVLSGSWYKNDPDKRLYETTPVDRKNFKADISKEHSKQLIEALKAKGKPVTDDAIIDLYNQTKRRGAIK